MNTNPSAPAPLCDCGHNHGTNLPLILSAVSLVVSVLTLCFLFLGVSKSIEPENDYGQVGVITGDNDAPAGKQSSDYGQVGTITGDNDAPAGEQPSEEGGGGGYEPLSDEPKYGLGELGHTVPIVSQRRTIGLSSFINIIDEGGATINTYANRDLLFSVVLPDTWVIGAVMPVVIDGLIPCPNTQDFTVCFSVRSTTASNTKGLSRSINIYVVPTARKSSPAVTDLPTVFLMDRNGRSYYMSTSGDEYGKPGMDTPEWKTIFEEGKKIRESFKVITK